MTSKDITIMVNRFFLFSLVVSLLAIACGEQEKSIIDTTPESVVFAALSNQEINTEIVSNTITIKGINSTIAISIDAKSGATFKVNNGEYVRTASVKEGDVVQIKVTTPSTYATTKTITLSVGTESNTWQVTSKAAPLDRIPDDFSFTSLTEQELSTTVTSNAITVNGVNSEVAVSVGGESGTQIKINDGAFTSSGKANEGDIIEIKTTTPSTHATTKQISVTVGTLTKTWAITTKDAPKQEFYSGSFVDVPSHQASGNVQISADESELLFQGVTFNQGPALEIWLSKTSTPNTQIPNYINLGAAQGTAVAGKITGDFTYAISQNIDFEAYQYVVIWCERFSVSFGYAELAK